MASTLSRSPIILFFIASTIPNDTEQLQIDALGVNVRVRNASRVSSVGCIEKCDGVAGLVPAKYEKVPKADTVLEKYNATRKATLDAAKTKVSDDAKAAKAKAEETTKAKAAAAPAAKAAQPNSGQQGWSESKG